MPKRAKKSATTCEDHLFILKPKQSFCRFGQTATISFCDPNNDKTKTKNKKSRNCQTLDCPIFNNDRNFATPTFILFSQKQYYQEKGIKMREQHERKMIEYTDEKDSLNVPKPRTRNNFCSVCRQTYQDYLEHVESQKHKKKINGSIFNKYILDVAEKFNPTPKNLLSTYDSDYLELLESKPNKKVKLDESYQRSPQVHDRMKSQIAPPPHLNLNNSAYFPGLGSNLNYFSNQVNPFAVPAPQMTFNYNMNFFWNPYYNHQPYGMMNPWMDYYQQNQMVQMPSIQLPRIEQNYFLQGNPQNRSQKDFTSTYDFSLKSQEKKEIITPRQQIIVIDDDDMELREKPSCKA